MSPALLGNSRHQKLIDLFAGCHFLITFFEKAHENLNTEICKRYKTQPKEETYNKSTNQPKEISENSEKSERR